MRHSLNRKLLVSVYNAQEAREAVLGGGRIIDSEDPKSALGNISPLRIMEVSESVLDYKRDLDIQLSTNIGEDQLIFRRTDSGRAIEKSPQEMAGKAAQAALGVALAMGTSVHPCNIVKVGLDGMPKDQLKNVLAEVVSTLRRTAELRQCQVMSVLFAQDLVKWDERKCTKEIRGELVALREFSPAVGAAKGSSEARFELSLFWDRLRDDKGEPLRPRKNPAADLALLKRAGILPSEVENDVVVLNELIPHFEKKAREKTTVEDIKSMIDLSVEAGADAIMLDTSILSKVSNICLVDTSAGGMSDFSEFIVKNGHSQSGILSLEQLKFFVDYCHYRGIVPNLAGSVDSIQAQQLWAFLPQLDQISTRSAASAAVTPPPLPGVAGAAAAAASSMDTRQLRTIVRQLVAGLAPPEHGGVLNVPIKLSGNAACQKRLDVLLAALRAKRPSWLPPLRACYVDVDGTQTEISEGGRSQPEALQPPSPTN